ncbi:hypothetical protein KCU90_g226, partial [Aureobasidium melanogenum]
MISILAGLLHRAFSHLHSIRFGCCILGQHHIDGDIAATTHDNDNLIVFRYFSLQSLLQAPPRHSIPKSELARSTLPTRMFLSRPFWHLDRWLAM